MTLYSILVWGYCFICAVGRPRPDLKIKQDMISTPFLLIKLFLREMRNAKITMKRIILILLLLLNISICYSIEMENFYMPKLNFYSCQNYVGEKVIVNYCESDDKRYLDTEVFKRYYGNLNDIYTIRRIRYGNQIVFLLVNDRGNKIKVRVNNGGPKVKDELSSCNIFFLIDDFYKYIDSQKGKIYKNRENIDVAVLQNIELVLSSYEKPVLVSNVKSLFTGDESLCLSHEVDSLCKNIGMILRNPKVKDSYKIIGLEKTPEKIENKGFEAEYPSYIFENQRTGEYLIGSAKDYLTSAFRKDLEGKYRASLIEVEKPINPEIRYGETTRISTEKGTGFCYKDNVIDILIVIKHSEFNFVLENVSDSSIKIIWDDAVFVDFDGSIEKVMHKGIKYTERNNSQPSTTIIRNSKWEDAIIPTHLVYYEEPTKYRKGGWRERSILPPDEPLLFGYETKQIKLMLPIQIKGIVNEYIFVFDVNYVFSYPERLNLEMF